MFCYAVVLSVVVRRDRTGSGSSRPYARTIRFLKTQSGRYFLNLVFSDMIQGLGFAFNYRWIRQKPIAMSGSACTFQGLAIQIGDISAALWVTTIAIHTMVTLALRKHPPKWTMYATIIFNWCFVAILAIVGPAALSKPHLGPFYAQAGGWCWIHASYDHARLWLHYFFIFMAIAVNTICYTITFLMLRHQAFQPSDTAAASSQSEPISQDNNVAATQSRPGTVLTKAANSDVERNNGSVKNLHVSIPAANSHSAMAPSTSRPLSPSPIDVLPSWLFSPPPFESILTQRRITYHPYDSTPTLIERTARKMLWYPPVYLILCLPLAAYRLAGIAGHDWGFHAQIACGCIFSLAGSGNVSLYWVTRKMGPGILSSSFKETESGEGSKDDELRMRKQPIGGTEVRSPRGTGPVAPKEIEVKNLWDTKRHDPNWNDHHHHHQNTYSRNSNDSRVLDPQFQKTWERPKPTIFSEDIHEMQGHNLDENERI